MEAASSISTPSAVSRTADGPATELAHDPHMFVRDTQGERLFLVSAEDACFTWCLACGMTRCLESGGEEVSAAEKATKYIHTHLNGVKASRSGDHDLKRVPSFDAIRAQVKAVLGEQRARVKPRSMVLDKKLLGEFRSAMRHREFERLDVCGECLQERTGKACCLSGTLNLAAFTRPRFPPILVVDGVEELREFREKRALSTQSPSRRSLAMKSAILTAVPFPSLDGNEAKRRRGEHVSHKVMFPLSSGGNDVVMLTDDQGQHLEINFAGSSRTFKYHNESGIDGTPLATDVKDDRQWSSVAGGERMPTREEAEALAREYPRIDRSGEGEHDIVFRAVLSMIGRTQADIESGQVSVFALAAIGRIPITASQEQVPVARGTIEGDERVTSFAEFIPAPSTVSTYCLHVTRFLVGIITTGRHGHQILEEALEQSKSSNGQKPLEEWNLTVLEEAIATLLYSFAANPSDIIAAYLKPFAFEKKNSSVNVANEADDEDDILDGDHVQQLAGEDEEYDEEHLRMTSVSQMKKIYSSLMWALKRAAIWRLCLLKEEDVGGNELTLLINELKGKPALPAIAKIISNLNSLDASSGRDRHLTQLLGPEGRNLVIRSGRNEFSAADMNAAYGTAFNDLRDAFLGLFGSEGNPVLEKLWLAICDPDPHSKVVTIGSKRSEQDAAELRMDEEVLRTFKAELQKRLESAPNDLRNAIERFREAVIGALYLFSGSVMRMPEISGLRLRVGFAKGNLYPDKTWLGTPTLVHAGIITKTQKEGFSVLCSFVAKSLMVLTKVLGPVCVKIVQAEFARCWQKSEAVESLDFEAIKRADRKLVKAATESFTSRPAVVSKLDRRFAQSLEKDTEVAIQKISEESFEILYDADLRHILGVNIALRCFGLKDMNILPMRHLLVLEKTNILLYVREIKRMSTERLIQELCVDLEKHISSGLTQESSVQALGSVGMHSALTNQNVYNAKMAIPGSDVSVPNFRYVASQCVEAAVSLAHGIPMMIRHSLGESSEDLLVNGRQLSIMERLLRRARSSDDPISARLVELSETPGGIDQFLLERLRVSLEQPKANWISPEQALATRAVFTTTEDVVIALACGSGKTMTTALPFSLAPAGFAVFIVPYKSLLENLYLCLTKAGIECMVMAPETLESDFRSDVFISNSWTSETRVRIVVAVADTAMKSASIAFLEAALLAGLLLGVVIDECHQLIMSSTYRDVQRQLRFLSCLRVPIILASGTLPHGFRQTLMSAFSINPFLAEVITNPMSLRGRMIADLVRVQAQSLETFENYVLDIVTSHFEQTQDSRGPILVFCMTQNMMQSLAERAESRPELEEVAIVTISSECTRSEMDEYFAAFEAPKRVLALSTTITAEGINYPVPIELVIVAAGTFGGALMVHQMFSRAGRGAVTASASQRHPRAMLLYAPVVAVQRAYGTVERMQSETRELLTSIVPFARGSVSSLLGFGSLQRLFNVESECGVIALERVLNGGSSKDDDRCGSCIRCVKGGWMYPAPPQATDEHVKAEQVMEKRMNEKMKVVRASSYVAVKAIITTAVRRFLKETSDRCLACGEPSHHALVCPAFSMNNYQCLYCLSTTHSHRDVMSWLKRENTIVNEEVKRWGPWQNEFDKFEKMNCAMLCRPGTSRVQVQPCGLCWFEHVPNNAICFVQGEGHKYSMRVLLTYIWYHEDVRSKLLSSIETVTPFDKEKIKAAATVAREGWKQFMRWAVYESVDGIQNLFRVVLFWKQNRSWE